MHIYKHICIYINMSLGFLYMYVCCMLRFFAHLRFFWAEVLRTDMAYGMLKRGAPGSWTENTTETQQIHLFPPETNGKHMKQIVVESWVAFFFQFSFWRTSCRCELLVSGSVSTKKRPRHFEGTSFERWIVNLFFLGQFRVRVAKIG